MYTQQTRWNKHLTSRQGLFVVTPTQGVVSTIFIENKYFCKSCYSDRLETSSDEDVEEEEEEDEDEEDY